MTTSLSLAAQQEPRTAEVRRDTAETRITVRLNLDGTGRSQLATGIGFFDHMLDQIARHGMIDLEVEAQGDLHIDGHHTVEDVGITIGQAVKQAVGDKKGITRYGHSYVPLDEALSRVVIDFSGRPGLVTDVAFTSGMIGTFDTQLLHEFFQGFRQPRLRHAAHRQPEGRERAPPGRDHLQGLRPRAAHGAGARSARRRQIPSTKGSFVKQNRPSSPGRAGASSYEFGSQPDRGRGRLRHGQPALGGAGGDPRHHRHARQRRHHLRPAGGAQRAPRGAAGPRRHGRPHESCANPACSNRCRRRRPANRCSASAWACRCCSTTARKATPPKARPGSG